MKNLFSFFAEHGVQYKQSNDFLNHKHPNNFLNHRGTYTAVLDHKFAIITKSRTDFGSLSNRSAIDLAFYPKIEEAIKSNKIMSYTNYNNMFMLFKFLVGVLFILRGGKEQAGLTRSNFCLLNVTSGKYLGRKKLEKVNLQDKSMSVSVKDLTWLDNTGYLDVVEYTENKHTSCVHQHKSNFIVTKRQSF